MQHTRNTNAPSLYHRANVRNQTSTTPTTSPLSSLAWLHLVRTTSSSTSLSNHSAEQPSGFPSSEVLESFFAVTGDAPGSFVHSHGQERIPNNWYKRPTANAYNILEVLIDVQVNNAMYPGIIRFGGNTRTANSFADGDLTDFTRGVFNAADLANGDKAAYFLLQCSLTGNPDISNPLLGAVGSVLGWTTQQLGPLSSKFNCPQLAMFDNQPFNKFPGASFKGSGTSD